MIIILVRCGFMVFNATFNTISAIYRGGQFYWWRKRGGGNQPTDELYHIMLYTSAWSRFQLTTSVVICTDCIGSCKSNYHTIMTTTDPILFQTIKEGWHYVDESRIYWSWCQIMNIFSLTYLQNLVPDSYLHTKNTTQ